MSNNRFVLIERGNDVFLFDKETEDFEKTVMWVDEGFFSDSELKEVYRDYHLIGRKHKGKVYFFQDWPC